tara:strand:+ start:894 stop:1100 length:207 start_codon:yes stop_codon:yes gene_type:complete
MKITVNGQNKQISINSPTLEKVLIGLGYNPRLIVVEFNGTILPPDQWASQSVKDKDSLEIVTIVGGGN